jgi:hypothetical protein
MIPFDDPSLGSQVLPLLVLEMLHFRRSNSYSSGRLPPRLLSMPTSVIPPPTP